MAQRTHDSNQDLPNQRQVPQRSEDPRILYLFIYTTTTLGAVNAIQTEYGASPQLCANAFVMWPTFEHLIELTNDSFSESQGPGI